MLSRPTTDPRFDPKSEAAINQLWQSHRAPNAEGPAWSMPMPPPNVTGALHMGHALDNTLQDGLTRWARARGKNALWLPGMDHGGIATQRAAEKDLEARGQPRDPQTLREHTRSWADRHRQRIRQQLQRLGASADWSRERFTLDPGFSKAVTEAFCRLHQDGLIERRQALVNWCCRCQTALSNIECPSAEWDTELITLRYPLADGPGSIAIATTRPETLFGDAAVAVNPKDPSLAPLIGRRCRLPLTDRTLPIIGDEHARFEGQDAIGTGALKVTPAHDFDDFEIARRHDLEARCILDEGGRLRPEAGRFAGLERIREARPKIIAALQNQGLIEKREPYRQAAPRCSRCPERIEPRLSTQWFLTMKPLAEPALAAHRRGELNWKPERWGAIYQSWLENIRDWCLSRALLWGHPIPAYYCPACDASSKTADRRFAATARPIIARRRPRACPRCGSEELEQDPDVCDTWFSAWLWPFAALGWPENSADYARFYPMSELVSGGDILFFWVARMIMGGLRFTGRLPFRNILLHGMVTDAQGQIQSKSSGNGIDPLQWIERWSCDALRYALIDLDSEAQELRLSEDKAERGQRFQTKLWNAARLILNATASSPGTDDAPEDRWILGRWATAANQVMAALDQRHLRAALVRLERFLRDELCAAYLELIKPRLRAGDGAARSTALRVLEELLRLLQPLMPFAAEAIWQDIPAADRADAPCLMRAPAPEPEAGESEPRVDRLLEIARAIRDLRRRLRLPAGAILGAELEPELAADLGQHGQALLARRARLTFTGRGRALPTGLGLRLYLDIDAASAARSALQARLRSQHKSLTACRRRLEQRPFLERASPSTIAQTRKRAAEAEAAIPRLLADLEALE